MLVAIRDPAWRPEEEDGEGTAEDRAAPDPAMRRSTAMPSRAVVLARLDAVPHGRIAEEIAGRIPFGGAFAGAPFAHGRGADGRATSR